MMFTLIDNIEVSVVSAAGPDGDYNDDGFVDGADFLKWQRGESPNPLAAGDLDAWKTNFGTAIPPAAAAIGAVPEPATLGLALVASGLGLAAARPRTKRAYTDHSER
jgi:hypothetical protein